MVNGGENKLGLSLLMSIYHKEEKEYFEEAIKSIMSQTLMPDEIVLIKDGPLSSELEEVINQWKQECDCLRIYGFKENVQLGRALRKGVLLCSHDTIARMDTDDIMLPDRLEKQYNYMRNHPDVSVVGGRIIEFDDERKYIKEKIMPKTFSEVKKYGKFRNPLNHMTVMFRKSAVLQAGNYKHFPFLEDYYLWIRMMSNNQKIENLPDVLVKVRTNDGMYTRRGGFSYFKRYYILRKKQYSLELLTYIEYIISIVLTMGIVLSPSLFRKIIYRKGLRKNG